MVGFLLLLIQQIASATPDDFLWRTRIIDYQLVMKIAKVATMPEKSCIFCQI
jgi:hypothetical protein